MVIITDESKCAGCNKCIMVCPIKYINHVKIVNGERKVDVDSEKCISCGRCVQICDHGARSYLNDAENFWNDLNKGEKITVIVAPSFVTNQYEKHKHFFGYLKSLGVNLVYDVSIGATITIWTYAKYIEENRNKTDFFISQPCPSIVNYIEKYAPNLISKLMPVQSPVISTAIYLKKYLGITGKIAFLSPCVAKKTEFEKSSNKNIVNYNVTFDNLREHLNEKNINVLDYPEVDFDNDGAGLGMLFSKPGGLKEGLLYHLPDLRIKQIEGTDKVYEYLKFLNNGGRFNEYDFVDILSCQEGCNVGAATYDENYDLEISEVFQNELLSDKRLKNQAKRVIDFDEYDKLFKSFGDTLKIEDFVVNYTSEPIEIDLLEPSEEALDKAYDILKKNNLASRKINCYSCGYKTCKDMARAIHYGYNVPSSCYQYNKKELEAQKDILEENEKYIRTILEHLTESVLVTDENGIIEFANKKTEDIFGYQLGEYFHKHIEEFTTGFKFSELLENVDYESSIEHKDGSCSYLKLKYSVIDLNKKLLYIFIITDITRYKELDGLKNQFVSMISHELRTPLTSIRGALGLISSGVLGELPDKVKKLLDIAGNNSIRLVNLINDILDLEKIKAGNIDFNFGEHEIMPLVEEAIAFNEEYAKQYNVKYEIIQRLENAFVNIDRDRLLQVITNLLSNAAKFSYADEVVSISVQRKQNLVAFSVENKGLGIPPEFHSKIFKSFSQVDSTNTRGKGGSGLGLHISQSIIHKMAGSIGFTSKVDESTTFYLELPEIYRHTSPNRVLICEDNKVTAICIQKMFDKLNYQSDVALSAKEAEHFFSLKEYDLMTLDLVLPDKNGLDLLDEIRNNKSTKNLPVIVITASEKDAAGLNLKHEIVDWLEKSFELEELEKSIEKIMNQKNATRVNILHIEDDEDILKIISEALKDVANVTKVNNLPDAKNIINESCFDIIILDYKFPDGSCEELFDVIQNTSNKNADLVIFSAYEISQSLTDKVDAVILKTKVSNEEFLECIQSFIDSKTNKVIVNGSNK